MGAPQLAQRLMGVAGWLPWGLVMAFQKKARAGRAAGVVGSGRAAHPRAKALALAVGHFPKAFPVLRLR